jgi:hypothetical protein
LNKGIWADLPVAAKKRSNTAAVAVPPPRWCNCPKIPPPGPPVYCSVPVFSKIKKMVNRKPMSPTRLYMKAFWPADAAESRWNQNAISQHEQTPTPSHPTKVSKRLLANTSRSIEKTKTFI